jgi:N6-L-threonylcarbamoyladenine synthase
MLLKRVEKASKETGIKQIAIAGGVSANSGLRSQLVKAADRLKWQIYIPDFQYCTDNAAMIAMAAHFKLLRNDFCDLSVSPLPNLAIQH